MMCVFLVQPYSVGVTYISASPSGFEGSWCLRGLPDATAGGVILSIQLFDDLESDVKDGARDGDCTGSSSCAVRGRYMRLVAVVAEGEVSCPSCRSTWGVGKEGTLTHFMSPDGLRQWFVDGFLHSSCDLPSQVDANGDLRWHYRGKLHRDGNQPAVCTRAGKKMWYQYGYLKRVTGAPFVEVLENWRW
jgi:hypothetical protein